MKLMKQSVGTVEKHIAARNALVAKFTLESLGEDVKRKVDAHILDMLVVSGISASRACRYKSLLRETQYYGMAALALAFLGIRPALAGILFRERWQQVRNPLVALTCAEWEIEAASDEIMRKHGVEVSLSDEDKRTFKWENVIPGSRRPRDMN